MGVVSFAECKYCYCYCFLQLFISTSTRNQLCRSVPGSDLVLPYLLTGFSCTRNATHSSVTTVGKMAPSNTYSWHAPDSHSPGFNAQLLSVASPLPPLSPLTSYEDSRLLMQVSNFTLIISASLPTFCLQCLAFTSCDSAILRIVVFVYNCRHIVDLPLFVVL